jgi:hypothetical protein
MSTEETPLLQERCECIEPGCPTDMEHPSLVILAAEADQGHGRRSLPKGALTADEDNTRSALGLPGSENGGVMGYVAKASRPARPGATELLS